MRAEQTGLAAWVERLSRRATLNDDDRARLVALRGRVVEVAAGTDFVRLGEHAAHVSLVLAGVVGQFGQTRDGNRQIVALHLAGEMADLPVAVLPNPCCPQTALGRAALLQIPTGAIDELVRASPRIAKALWQDCCVDATVVERWLVRNCLAAAEGRLASFLCEIALRIETLGGGHARFELGLTQSQLGEILGLTSVHVNRTIRKLRERGLIEWSGRDIRILDWKELVYLGDFDPAYLHLHGRPQAGAE